LDTSLYVNRDEGWVRSDTGQVLLNYQKEFCSINAPSAQGVTAFFSRNGTFNLADTSFKSENEYGAALVVSMDGLPIRSSKRVLVQFGTRCRPTDWAEKASTIQLDGGKSVSGFEVVASGKAPWLVKKADLDVTIKNPGLTKVVVLDMNGNAAGSVALTKVPGGVGFRFPSSAMYVVVE